MSDKKEKKEDKEIEEAAKEIAKEVPVAPPAASQIAQAQPLGNAPVGAPPAANIQNVGIAEDSFPPMAPQRGFEEAAKPVPEQPEAPAASPQVPQPAPELSVPEKAAKRDQQQLAFMGDLQQNRIQPKTYHDLFEEKSTLGKIGTIFGLMVAGAGAGLTHQPNALMEMMNKEIERDLEGQKQNQANKQNWYNFSLQHQLQQPEVAEKWSRASQAENLAERTAWQNKQMGIESKVANNDARNLAGAAAIHNVQLMIDKMPEGPQKANMQNQMNNVLLPNFMKEAQQRNMESEGVNKLGDAINPVPAAKLNLPPKGMAPTGKTFDVMDQRAFNEKVRRGQAVGEYAGPLTNSISPADAKMIQAEAAPLKFSRDTMAATDQAFNNLAKLPRAGETPLGKVAQATGTLAGGAGAMMGPLGLAVASVLGTVGGREAGQNIEEWFQKERNGQVKALQSRLDNLGVKVDANTLLPSWANINDPKAVKELHDRTMQLLRETPAEAAARTGTMSLHGLYVEPPKYGFSVPKVKEEKRSAPEAPKSTEPKKAPATGIGAAASAPGIFEDYRQ